VTSSAKQNFCWISHNTLSSPNPCSSQAWLQNFLPNAEKLQLAGDNLSKLSSSFRTRKVPICSNFNLLVPMELQMKIIFASVVLDLTFDFQPSSLQQEISTESWAI